MSADSYLEYFTIFFGWIINNAIWNIAAATGFFAIPLALKVAAIWQKVREEGDDEGNKGALALPRLENTIYMSMLVIMFCVFPIKEVDIRTISFDADRSKECGVSLPAIEKTGYAKLVNEFDGQVAQIPLWWYLVHSVSKGFTRAAIASIPCGDNLRQLRFEVQHSYLRDPTLIEEVEEFTSDCYSKAYYRAKVMHQRHKNIDFSRLDWIGNDFLLNTPGYYDYYTTEKPKLLWDYVKERDSGYADVGQGGYPTCKQWWQDADIGLKHRLIAFMNNPIKNKTRKVYGPHWEETLLKRLVSPRHIAVSGSGESHRMSANEHSTGPIGHLKRFAATLGLGWNQMTANPGFDAMKQALPMVQALLEMVIIIAIPIIIMFSAYSAKTVLTITFAQFALIFISFWWELAGWLDDRLIRILYDSLSKGGGGSNIPFAGFMGSTADGWIMNLILGSSYVAIPVVWFGMMSWTGVEIGGAISKVLGDASKPVNTAAQDGAGKLKNAASAAITKGNNIIS